MRVLHVLEPSTGGVARNVLDLAAAQVARGHEVGAAIADRDGLPAALMATGAGVVTLPFDPRIEAAGADARVLRALAATARRGRWDVVHTHGNKGGVLGRLAARSAGLPVVHSAHGFAYLSQRRRERAGAEARRALTLGIERALAPAADVIVCVSAWERERALADGIADGEKLTVVANGVRLPDGPIAPDPDVAALRVAGEPLVGFLARLKSEKDPMAFLDAVERAGCRAVVVGEGELEAAVRARVAAIGERVAFVPFPGAAQPALAALDVFVLSSLWESLPIGVLEAMAVGVPVVATDTGGVPEAVLDGETGLLVSPADPDALAAAIARLVADAALRERLGAAGRAHCAARFSIDAMVEGIEAAYRRARARRCSSASS